MKRTATLLACLAVGWLLMQPVNAQAQGAPEPPWGKGQSQAEDLRIKFVAFSPGDDIPSWFGHAAIVVEDTRLDVSRLYNYGMFKFNGALLVKFAMGRLWFWVGQQPEYATYEFYKGQERDVHIYVLNLPPPKRMEVAKYLAWNVRPDNRQYLYHHYFDNCSTRPRDILDKSVNGALHRSTDQKSKLSLREHTRRFTHHNFFMDLLLMYMMNDDIDQPIENWDAMFLPGELEEAVRNLTYETSSGDERKLVKKRIVYYDADREEPPDRAPAHWPWALLMSLVAAAGGLAGARWWQTDRDDTPPRVVFGLYNAFIGLVLGLPGLMLFVMSIATDHKVTYWNENLFFANPLTFAVLPLGIAIAWGKKRPVEWLKWIWTALVATGALGLVLKVVPGFDQQNHLPIVFIYPISIGLAAALWLLESEPN